MLNQHTVVEILHEDLRQNMEVFFIEGKCNLDQIVYLIDMGQLELIIFNNSDDLQNLIFEDFITTDWFLI